MPDLEFFILQRANRHLRLALQSWQPEQKQCSAIPASELSNLRAELEHAGECLRQLEKPGALPEAGEKHAYECEAQEYRNHLENLRRFLPGLYARLLAQRARIQDAQSHLAGAAAWAGANKKIL